MHERPIAFLINGPNANMYGLDPKGTYGDVTLPEIERSAAHQAESLGFELDCRQSNDEGALIDWINEACLTAAGIIINAASLTYTSLGLLDALAAFQGPVFEVHMTNIHRREPFRHHSYISKASTGIIAGFGRLGYELAVIAMAAELTAKETSA